MGAEHRKKIALLLCIFAVAGIMVSYLSSVVLKKLSTGKK